MRKKKILFKLVVFIIVFVGVHLISLFKCGNTSSIYNKIILEENSFLKKELNDLREVAVESDNYFISKVLYRDVYSFYDEIVINNLNKDIRKGDAVINENGLIGIVYKSNDNLAYAKLLTSNYNVSVVIGDVYGNLNNGIISMLNKYSDIKVGDFVYTSGYGEVEKGLLVGTVCDVSYDNDGLGKEVKVKLIDNNYLNYVGIVRKLK